MNDRDPIAKLIFDLWLDHSAEKDMHRQPTSMLTTSEPTELLCRSRASGHIVQVVGVFVIIAENTHFMIILADRSFQISAPTAELRWRSNNE